MLKIAFMPTTLDVFIGMQKKGDGYIIFINHDKINALPPAQQDALLAHEFRHLMIAAESEILNSIPKIPFKPN